MKANDVHPTELGMVAFVRPVGGLSSNDCLTEEAEIDWQSRLKSSDRTPFFFAPAPIVSQKSFSFSFPSVKSQLNSGGAKE